jgi:RNA polymerase sigma factor (sigma-70 family)
MINPFVENRVAETASKLLIDSALKGDKNALEELIRCHQDWIYNIALRMVWNPQDAEDVTQEVLIKILTKLSTFKGKSSFRTWVYRIVANHVINMKKRGAENQFVSLSQYWNDIENTPDMDLPDQKSVPVDLPLIVEETTINCMMGMLLCLNRQQRFIFILGEIFRVTDRVGSEIVEISRDNFRQRLSRARKQVYSFMNEKCGLVKKENPCHCNRKTQALIKEGLVNPENLMFNSNYIHRVKAVSEKKQRKLSNFFDNRCRDLFHSHPFQRSPDFVVSLQKLLSSNEFRQIINFGNLN